MVAGCRDFPRQFWLLVGDTFLCLVGYDLGHPFETVYLHNRLGVSMATVGQSLLAIHRGLPKGLGLWLDFSATPKDQNGMYFPWTVCDYPLAQAVEDRIVKAPLIVTKEDDPKQPTQDPEHVTKDNVAEKYGYWLRAAVQRWKDHWSVYKKLDTKPVLFIMAEKNVYADALGAYLWKTKEFGFKEAEVLVILRGAFIPIHSAGASVTVSTSVATAPGSITPSA